MIAEKDLEIARELKQRLSEIVSLADFKVYGSRARGDADQLPITGPGV